MHGENRYWVGAWLVALGSAIAGAQGCVLDGDASLGNDGNEAGSGGTEDNGGSATTSAGQTTQAGKPSSGGKGSGVGGATPLGGTGGNAMSEAGAPSAAAGETSSGGAPSVSGDCALPIDPGPCDGAIKSWAFDTTTGACKAFVFGGCEGNANRFRTQTACQAACEAIECPSYLQTDTVYEVFPLNRPERACIDFPHPTVVSCSMLLNPTETVPTNYGTQHCVKRDDQLYYAGTTLPKANGWVDCGPAEAATVAAAPSCEDL
jgi:hypothetical protein